MDLNILKNNVEQQLRAWPEQFLPPELHPAKNEKAWTYATQPEDFFVEEIPLYTFSGEGEHLYLFIEKRERATHHLVKDMCQEFKLRETEIGVAGRKDTYAVTRQWLSLPFRKVNDSIHRVEEMGPYKILQSARHGNKLKLGHLRGNFFRVQLRGGELDDAVHSRLNHYATHGFPNFFGFQRFGKNLSSVDRAIQFLVRGKKARGRGEQFFYSVVQSIFFNNWLSHRLLEGSLNTPKKGDVLLKAGNLAPFYCEDIESEKHRLLQRDAFLSGPLYGGKFKVSQEDALSMENKLLSELGLDVEQVCRTVPTNGTRRLAYVFPQELAYNQHAEDHIEVSFTLPKGSFASVFLQGAFSIR